MNKIKLPKHSGLIISHNQHKYSGMSINDYVTDYDYTGDDFEYNECIKHDSIWEMTWYPDTPIGCYDIYSSTFEGLFEDLDEYDTINLEMKESTMDKIKHLDCGLRITHNEFKLNYISIEEYLETLQRTSKYHLKIDNCIENDSIWKMECYSDIQPKRYSNTFEGLFEHIIKK